MNNNTNTLLFKPLARHRAPFSLRYLHTGAVLLIVLFLMGCMHAEEAPTQEGTAMVSTALTTAAVVLPTPIDLLATFHDKSPPPSQRSHCSATSAVPYSQDGETLLGLALTLWRAGRDPAQNDLGEALWSAPGSAWRSRRPPSGEVRPPLGSIHAVGRKERRSPGIGQTYAW
jgi:hypothetical protein